MRWLLGLFALCALGVALTAGLTGCGDGDSGCKTAQDCNDNNDCTRDACDTANGTCSNTPLADGALCEGGECQNGSCGAIASVFPCTEQGIRDAIAEGGGPHAFDCNGPTTVITEAEIIIDKSVILDGRGDLTVDGGDDHRVFSVTKDVAAELRGFTVRGGRSSQGGGIYNAGTLRVADSAITENYADLYGGGILNEVVGTALVANSTLSKNVSGFVAGASNNRGTLTLTNSTVSHNSAAVGAEGIFNDGGTLTVTSCTISETTELWGSAIGNFSQASPVTVTNTIIDGDCVQVSGSSGGGNIESPGNTCGFDEAKDDKFDVTEEQLNLGELADNGGLTMTHKPGDGDFGEDSVAIDAVRVEDCEVDEDQRGEPRPAGSGCDVGSVEVQEGGQ